MTGAQRRQVKQALDAKARASVRYDSRGRRIPHDDAGEYEHLPTVEEARQMVRWVECPVHKLKVGCDPFGLVGRCSECAAEAARAIAELEAA